MRSIDALGCQGHVNVDLIAGELTDGENGPVKAGGPRFNTGGTVPDRWDQVVSG